MPANEAFQKALRVEFENLKLKNRAFSLRAYAKRLGINSGVLSSILTGRRRVSSRYAKRLLDRMSLPPDRRETLTQVLECGSARGKSTKPALRVLQLRSDEFHLISDGIHYSILCLFELSDFVASSSWMAKRLKTTEAKVKAAVERLIRLGLISVERREMRLTGIRLTTTDGVADSAIQRFHEERLEEARQCLIHVPVDERYFFSTTMAVKAANVPGVQHLVSEFKRKVEDLLEQEPKTEVYRLCIQLFPATDRRKVSP